LRVGGIDAELRKASKCWFIAHQPAGFDVFTIEYVRETVERR
jgi:hypothetical protein